MEDARRSWVEREARKEDGGGDKKEICRNKAKKKSWETTSWWGGGQSIMLKGKKMYLLFLSPSFLPSFLFAAFGC